jgi:hypothetical protein
MNSRVSNFEKEIRNQDRLILNWLKNEEKILKIGNIS